MSSDRLRSAQHDAAAYAEEVRSVIAAQRQQIAQLERQARQLAKEAASEQRFAAALNANDKATRLQKLREEHTGLAGSLDHEGKRALTLATSLEMAETGMAEMRTNVAVLEQQRTASSKGKRAPMRLKMMRALSETDAANAKAAALRDEVTHLRRERLVFLSKLRDIEAQLDEEHRQHDMLIEMVRETSSKKDMALTHARHLSDANEKRSHQRAIERQQVDAQQAEVEKKARTVRNKLRQSMMNNAIAATAGGSMIHKMRVQKAAWPPAKDTEGLLRGTPPPQSLREHVAILAYLIGDGCPEEIDGVCEALLQEDQQQQSRAVGLEEKRRRLASEEEKNERSRKELGGLEATGGVDTPEHISLREQLTEMQSQAVQIRAAEERHQATLERLGAVSTYLQQALGMPPSPSKGRGASASSSFSEVATAAIRLADEKIAALDS